MIIIIIYYIIIIILYLDSADLFLVGGHRDVGLELIKAHVNLFDTVAFARVPPHRFRRGGGRQGGIAEPAETFVGGLKGDFPFGHHILSLIIFF